MKERIWVTVQYASSQQCCKTHNRRLPFFTFLYSSVDIFVCLMCMRVFVYGVKFIVRLLPQVYNDEAASLRQNASFSKTLNTGYEI